VSTLLSDAEKNITQISREEQHSGIDWLQTLMAPAMARVNALIRTRMRSEIPLIPTLADYLLSAGGKRLRPLLTLTTSALNGYDSTQGNDDAVLAASIEFMHAATLLHDDVVDDSDMRRGRQAARVVWGNAASVLVGDFLLGQAFSLMVQTNSLPALKALSHAAMVIAEGEVHQLEMRRNIGVSQSTYLTIITAKTASLFAVACQLGPLLAQKPEAICQAYYTYGLNLGIAFQLIDDVLDYGGESQTLGKDVGDDFREGKITLPVIIAIAAAKTQAEREFWHRTLALVDQTPEDLNTALELLWQHGALSKTVKCAQEYGERATHALSLIPDDPLKKNLLDVVHGCIHRAV
jgi:octaprenyl-diphosphate synthase